MSEELQKRAHKVVFDLAALDESKKPGGGWHGQMVGCEPYVIRSNGYGLQCLYDAQELIRELLERATPSTIPASEGELPPLPELLEPTHDEHGMPYGFTAGQMRDYARAALASTRTASYTPVQLVMGALAAGQARRAAAPHAPVGNMVGEFPPYAASDTRTAAGEAECDAALGRAAPAGQHDAVDLVLMPTDPSDEVLRAILSVTLPATFRRALRDPLNGPRTAADVEKSIEIAKRQYAAARTAISKDNAATRSRAEGGNTCTGSPDLARTQADAGKDSPTTKPENP